MWSIISIVALASIAKASIPSITSVSGTHEPNFYCAGSIIFNEEFYELDFDVWEHENTLAGGGNWEFEYYNNNRTNSFTRDGLLYIRPSLTSDQYGEPFLTSGRLNVDDGTPAGRCTNAQWFGCERTGTASHVLNPIKSARIRTVNSFNFRYGLVEVRAKMPAGDWLWPAIWLLPTNNVYGTWPASGEIDLVESRGNRNMSLNGEQIGTQQARSSVRFGPYPGLNEGNKTHWVKKNESGYANEFHRYQMAWTQDYIRFGIDDEELGYIYPDEGGFWKIGGFNNVSNINNPWQYGTKMAPFDQKFYIVINLAVGGVNGYFPDGVSSPTPKPWGNQSPAAATDFWKAKDEWLPTWKLDENEGLDASLQVDYVRVWAL